MRALSCAIKVSAKTCSVSACGSAAVISATLALIQPWSRVAIAARLNTFSARAIAPTSSRRAWFGTSTDRSPEARLDIRSVRSRTGRDSRRSARRTAPKPTRRPSASMTNTTP